MSISPAVLDALLAAGVSAEQIVAAVKADAAEEEARKEKKRAGNRERQRRFREAHNAGNALQDVTECDGRDEPSPQSPPLKSPPDPQKITPPLTPHPVVVEARASCSFPPPDGVGKDQWKAFRQQRKKALTDRAYLMICNKLSGLAEAGWPPGEMIDLAIERGWETVFEPRDQANGQRGRDADRGSGGRMGGPGPSSTLAMLRAANAAIARDREDHGGAWPALPPAQHS